MENFKIIDTKPTQKPAWSNRLKNNFLNSDTTWKKSQYLQFLPKVSVLLVTFSRLDVCIFHVRRFPFLAAKHDAGPQMLYCLQIHNAWNKTKYPYTVLIGRLCWMHKNCKHANSQQNEKHRVKGSQKYQQKNIALIGCFTPPRAWAPKKSSKTILLRSARNCFDKPHDVAMVHPATPAEQRGVWKD